MKEHIKWAKAMEAKKEQDLKDGNKILKEQLRSLTRKLARREAAKELILEGVKEVLADHPIDVQLPKEPKTKKSKSVETAVLHISDTQVGKKNRCYSTDIARERIALLAQKTAHLTNIRRSYAQVDELHVYLGGDIVEGENIFPNQGFLIDSSVFNQAVKNAPVMLTEALVFLSGQFKKIVVKCVAGNHGRNGPHESLSHPETNWDNVAYEVTKLMLMSIDKGRLQERIQFDISSEFWSMDYIYDWGNLIVHGDQMPSSSPTSVDKKALGWAMADEIPHWNYLWYGHFHNFGYRVVNRLTCLSNGTTESANEYALGRMAATGYPSQRLAFFAPDYGLIADHQVYLCESGVRRPNTSANRG
jgi:hypothetical protein